MRRLMVKFILLFAVVGESSLVVLAVRREAPHRTADCSIVGVGSTAAHLDAVSGTVHAVPATCEGFLQQASAVDLLSVTRR